MVSSTCPSVCRISRCRAVATSRRAVALGLAVVVVLLQSTPAAAGIYQCKDANGKVSFSDRPCPDGVESREVETSSNGLRAPARQPADAKRRGDPHADALTGRSLATYKRKQAISKRMASVSKALTRQIRDLESAEKALRNTDYADSKRMKRDLRSLRKARKKLQAPQRSELKVLKEAAASENQALTDLMQRFCRTPAAPTSGVTRTCRARATFHDAFMSYTWRTAGDKQTHWAHVRLRDKPQIPKQARKLNEQYFIKTHNEKSIWVWAGNFLVAFVVSDARYYGHDRVADALSAFVDLDGLAAIQPDS